MGTELALSSGDPTITHRMLDIIKTGDIGRLNEQEQLAYYLHECNRMGLDPAARPLEWVRLQGKLTLYAKRVAGDMLAAKHDVSVVITDGPRVLDLAGTQLLFARAKASMPNGRSVEDVATLPVSDLVNGVMKVTSKAIRRATLRLCGWGGLDESELETIPARAVEYVVDDGPHAAPGPDTTPRAERLLAAAKFEDATTRAAIAAAFISATKGLTLDDAAVQEQIWKAVTKRAKGLRVANTEELRAEVDALRSGRSLPVPTQEAPVTQPDALTDAQETVRRQYTEAVDVEPTTLDGLLAAWRKYAAELKTFPKLEREAAWSYLVQAASTLTPPVSADELRALLSPKGDGPKGGKRTRTTRSADANSAPVDAPASNDGPSARWVFVEDEAVMRTADARDYTHVVDGNAWRTHLEREPNWYAMVGAYTKRVELFGALGGERRAALVDAVATRRNTDRVRAEELIAPEIRRQAEARKARERRAA